MEFALSEEQAELAATIRSLLEKRADSAAVRAASTSDDGYDPELWQTLCEQIGVAALAVPEDLDGVGATLMESMVVLEELGRSLAPSPLLASIVTAEAVLAGADDEAKARLLPRLARGEIGAFAVLDADGAASGVLDVDRAAVLVVAADEDLYEVDPASAERDWQPSMDQSVRLGSLRADVASATRIGVAGPAVERASLVGAAGAAALAVGCAARGVDMTVGYSKERVQFGRPIGSFQALKHRMAEMLVLVEMARSASWAASYALSSGSPQAAQLVHVAKAYASDALARIAAETVQLHGGIAITWEHDAHLVFKRAHALGQLFGDATSHRALVELP
ncbi:acyl-CoA dehydrogenase family protein [Nocardioides acrostichi]|uniref:Acyl-CoA dehydrogenase family protein n=1 Tax=Nocardioides acrostichi TaxID=2784339 RepID=A0A930Y7J5_9ACTN|nr:acyl-CoA dehydrogenase family protein [Nocardioides acrostichi]MBF4162097.1 acyl-CoA dehydrogenase family protein [Nocardioides acrostichi]